MSVCLNTICEPLPQVFLLLFVRSKAVHREAVERVVDGHDDACARARLGDGDHAENVRDVVHACSAVFRRDGHTHDPHLAELPADLFRMPVGLVEIRGDRLYLRFRKPCDLVLYHLLFFCQTKIHNLYPPSVIYDGCCKK